MRRGPFDLWGNVMVGAAVAVVVLGAWSAHQLYYRKD